MNKAQQADHNYVIERILSLYEVPFDNENDTIVGKLGSWRITKAGPNSLWVAETTAQGEGLPLEVATELYGRQYGNFQLGKLIRAGGHASGVDPFEYALPNLSNFCPDGLSLPEIRAAALRKDQPLFVDKYHIDYDVALIHFVNAVKSVLSEE